MTDKTLNKQLIYTKIPKIMSLVGVIGKDRNNTTQNYKFRGIDDMYNALNEHLAKEGVFATSTVVDMKREERPSKNGGVLLYSILTMQFEFFAEDGSSVKSTTIGEAMDSGDKSMNKAMSTAYKYALMQIFCIPTEDEKDTEYQTHQVVKTTPPNAPGQTKTSTPTNTATPATKYAEQKIVTFHLQDKNIGTAICNDCGSHMFFSEGVSKTTNKKWTNLRCEGDKTHVAWYPKVEQATNWSELSEPTVISEE